MQLQRAEAEAGAGAEAKRGDARGVGNGDGLLDGGQDQIWGHGCTGACKGNEECILYTIQYQARVHTRVSACV
jgi:hypothetical protein